MSPKSGSDHMVLESGLSKCAGVSIPLVGNNAS